MTDDKLDTPQEEKTDQNDDIGLYEQAVEDAKDQQEQDRREAYDGAQTQQNAHDSWALGTDTDDIGSHKQVSEESTEQQVTHSESAPEPRAPEQLEQREWIREMRDVNVGDLPDPADIHGPEDFHKVSAEQMHTGIERLQEMKPLIDSGEASNSDYWYNVDQERGLGPGEGYQSTYDAFYGNDRIHLTKEGDQYDITNGRHRIWVAKEMGVNSLPAEVVERRQSKD